MIISLSPFAPENLVSQDGFDRPVPREPAHSPLITEFHSISAAASIYLYRHPPSGQSRVYRVTHLRTDGVHCLESAGTGPVVLKVVPVAGAALAGHHGPIFCAPLFSHTYYYWYVCCCCCCFLHSNRSGLNHTQ